MVNKGFKMDEKVMNDAQAVCPVCGSDDPALKIQYINEYWPDLQYFNDLDIVGCQACGFGYSWPEIQDKIIDEFYKSEYRRCGGVFYIDFDAIYEKPLSLDSRALAQLLLAKQYVDFNEGDCFLEIGPGGGGAFNVAEQVLPNPKIVGIELNHGAKEAFKRVYNIEILPSLEDFVANGYAAKICLLSHSLEHFKLSWLESALHDFKRLIAPGGILVIEVPLTDMRKHQDCGVGVSPHFLFFSLDSIKLLFERNHWNVLYLNSCSGKYGDWIESKKIQNNNSSNSRAFLSKKSAIKFFFRMLPGFVQNLVRRVLRYRINFAGQEFSYGGDRTCLRLVVQPAHNEQFRG